MKIIIYRIIGISKLAYINFLDDEFAAWCQPIAKAFFLPKRVLITNTQLYNWFVSNYENRTALPFLKENANYIEAGIVAPNRYFDLLKAKLREETSLSGIYPSVLIKQIKKAHYDKINAQQENS